MNQRERRIAAVAELDGLGIEGCGCCLGGLCSEDVGAVVSAIERADAAAPEPDPEGLASLTWSAWVAGVASWLEAEHGPAAAEGFRTRARMIGGKL